MSLPPVPVGSSWVQGSDSDNSGLPSKGASDKVRHESGALHVSAACDLRAICARHAQDMTCAVPVHT
jgi:hypothetical protein